jgi:Tol biopolymer transport system component/ABC-type branched-subunit amino acid transport system substrate-binding protein
VSGPRSCLVLLGCVLVVVATAGATAVGESLQAAHGRVVVPPGQPVQIAVAVDDTGLGASFGASARDAVQMAIERHPTIRGFAITVNAFNAPCGNGSPAALGDTAATANAVVGNAQNLAVVGHPCSPEASTWLPTYQAAGLVTINGSTTGAYVTALGPTVFNGTAVPDPDFTPWYAAVKALPSDLRWRSSFQARFGSPPSDYADLYYDAANVLLTAMEETATIESSNLVIDPAALASAVRRTAGLPGVTCSITLDPATGYRVDDAAALARCANAASEIVFSSDRASGNPGEIYALSAGRAPVDVSRSPAADAGVAVRPDGKQVAFWSERTGAPRLYLSRPDGSGLHMLPRPDSDTGAYNLPSVFSPDGSRLLAATGGSQCGLFLIDLRSLRSRRIANSCSGASWSPDGSLIVAPVGAHPRQVVFDAAGKRLFSVPGTHALWSARGQLAVVNAADTATIVVDEHGSLLARLPEAAADWSLDGNRLVLTRPGAILLADSASLARTRVLVRGPSSWIPGGVAFTPDGAFVRCTRPSGDLVAVPVTSGTPRVLPGFGVWSRNGRYAFTRLLPPALAGSMPRVEVEIGDRFGRHARQAGQFAVDDEGAATLAWSADGTRLIYESRVRASHDLWAVAPDGSDLHRLTQGGPDRSAPAWSADGTRLAYTSAPFTGGHCGFCPTSVVIADSAGQVLSALPGASAGQASEDDRPSWSPTGRRLVVSMCCSGELDVVGDDGSGRRPLAPGPAGDFAGLGVWSPDDSSIAYFGKDGIESIAPVGSGQRLLLAARGGHSPTALAWSHDGKLLAYSAADGIHVLAVDGSVPPRLLVGARQSGGLSFSPDDSQIVYAAQHPGPVSTGRGDLFVISLQGGPARELAPSPSDDTDPAWRPLPAS